MLLKSTEILRDLTALSVLELPALLGCCPAVTIVTLVGTREQTLVAGKAHEVAAGMPHTHHLTAYYRTACYLLVHVQVAPVTLFTYQQAVLAPQVLISPHCISM